jgi:hypothetical protein
MVQGNPLDLMKCGIDPNNSGALFGRGVGRLMAPPDFGGDLGEAFKRKDLNDKAKGASKKALELNPNYSAAAQALAELK